METTETANSIDNETTANSTTVISTYVSEGTTLSDQTYHTSEQSTSSSSTETISTTNTTSHTSHADTSSESSSSDRIDYNSRTTTYSSIDFSSDSETSGRIQPESSISTSQTMENIAETTDPSPAFPVVAVVVPIVLLVIAAIVLYILWRKMRRAKHSKSMCIENGEAVRKNGRELIGEKIPIHLNTSLEEMTSSIFESAIVQDSNSESEPVAKALHNSDQSKKTPDRSKNSSDQSSKSNKDRTPSPKSKQEEFFEHIRRLQEDLMLYQKEFERLPNGSNKTCSVAKSQNNISKNRYINILPYDDNRVILSKKNEDDSDYINASYVDGAKKKRAYIASQGPTSATVADFWLMIWDNECNRILMLTNLEESVRGLSTIKTGKCAKYWPSSVGEEVRYGELSVRLLSETDGKDWIIRTLAVRQENCNSVRIVQQYHYVTWPDQDVPHACTAVLQFHRLSLKSCDALSASGPILVHCSAGVGRTGTMIAIDILEELWEESKPFCDVFKVVKCLRRQRMSMVQSVRQYMFIHHSLVQAFFVGDFVELKPEVIEFYQLTSKQEEQYKILDAISTTTIPHCSVAKSKPTKNRLATVLPVNSSIRFLKPVKEDENIYINAISIHGFHERHSFLVTQMPLKDTINDLWRLANDCQCPAIVMLNSDFEPDERYWPEEQTMKTKSFKIQKSGNGNQMADGLLATDLEICYHGNLKKSEDSSSEEEEEEEDGSSVNAGSRRSSRDNRATSAAPATVSGGGPVWNRIVHLRVTDWPETETVPSDPLLLLSLYDQIVQLRSRSARRPIIIHCLYGTARCGLLCALVNVLDRLNAERIVGIFDAVKLLKERRHQLIPDIEQYDYLHKLVSIYLKRERERGHVDQAMTSQTTVEAKQCQSSRSVNQTDAEEEANGRAERGAAERKGAERKGAERKGAERKGALGEPMEELEKQQIAKGKNRTEITENKDEEKARNNEEAEVIMEKGFEITKTNGRRVEEKKDDDNRKLQEKDASRNNDSASECKKNGERNDNSIESRNQESINNSNSKDKENTGSEGIKIRTNDVSKTNRENDDVMKKDNGKKNGDNRGETEGRGVEERVHRAQSVENETVNDDDNDGKATDLDNEFKGHKEALQKEEEEGREGEIARTQKRENMKEIDQSQIFPNKNDANGVIDPTNEKKWDSEVR